MTAPETPTPAEDPTDPTVAVPVGQAADAQPLLVRLARMVEDEQRLDGAVAALRPVADRLASSSARGLLLGRPLGHAAHPLLTDVPLGAWMSASVLDLVGGRAARPAARRLVGLGVLSAVPTAVTGLAEWSHTDERQGRVGAVHATSNTIALLLYGASYISRLKKHQGRGAMLALAGGMVSAVGGYLGAHMAIARDVGSRDAAFADSLPEGASATGTLGGRPMLT